jgi:hypothetical protein
MRSRAFVILLGTALVAAASPPPDVGMPQDPRKTGDLVTGSVPEESLVSESPDAGLIVTEKRYTRLLEVWGIERAPRVDFSRQFVVVGTTRGSKLTLNTRLDDGDLKVRVMGTADMRPGFRYALLRVERGGVRSVNGKPLPTGEGG